MAKINNPLIVLEKGKDEQTKTVDLAMADGNQRITPDSGKTLSGVTVNKPATMLPANIKKDVDIGGVVGTLEEGIDISDTTATAADVRVGKDFYVADGTKTQGTIADYDGSFVVNTPALEEATWTEIATASANGTASSSWSVGDEKTITLTTGEEVTLQILGFNHDDLADGSGKAGITFGMQNLLNATYPMNDSDTNIGGWSSSKMRTSTMATLLSQLPTDLMSVIKQVSKKGRIGSGSDTTVTSTDTLFLFSINEIVTNGGVEGTKYEYWQNTTKNDRVKRLSNGSGSARAWWLRSPKEIGSAQFDYIDGAGTDSFESASEELAICFGFCV